jgi:hypothetical protein
MREGAADMSSTVSDQIFTLAGSMSNRNSTGGEPARGHQAPCREVRPLQQGMPATGRSGVGYVALDALSYDGAQQLLNETDRSGEGRRSYVGAGHAPRSKPTGTPRSRGICASCSVAPTRAILRRSWRRSRSSLAHDRAVPLQITGPRPSGRGLRREGRDSPRAMTRMSYPFFLVCSRRSRNSRWISSDRWRKAASLLDNPWFLIDTMSDPSERTTRPSWPS